MENISNVASSPDDGAGEKLVGDEKNGHNSKGNIEVRYMTPTSQNGDAKLDIENLKNAFAGMSKEELMKFANDPFWVRTRWFLFFLFWFLWAAMLAAAIAIIVLAPKCAAPLPREWWEQSPAYKVDVSKFTKGDDSAGFAGVTTKLEYLKDLNIKSVILSPVVDIEKEDLKSVSSNFGTLDDFKKLLTAAKENGINLLLTFIPNFSSVNNPTFNKSALKEEPYSSYFVWSPNKGFDSENNPTPPNNWLSVNNGSAWEWHSGRKEFYLHQFSKNQPDFNFRNPNVTQYITDVFKYWLNLGVSGLFLEDVKYLLEDQDLKDAVPSSEPGYGHDQYEFYDHSYTSNLAELTPLLQQWSSTVANQSGVLFLDDVSLSRNRTAGNLMLTTQVLKADFSGRDLNKTITQRISSNNWPSWRLQSEDAAKNKALQLLTLLLPGTPVMQAGEELGLSGNEVIPWSNNSVILSDVEDVNSQKKNPDSMLNSYKILIETRKSHSILYGTLDTHVFNSTTGAGPSVFAYTRIKSGNPGYLVVYNTGASNETINLQDLTSVPSEVTVVSRTELLHSALQLKSKIDSDAVSLPGYSLAVFSFVPKAKES